MTYYISVSPGPMCMLINVGSSDVGNVDHSLSCSNRKTRRLPTDSHKVEVLKMFFKSGGGECLGIRDTGRFACVCKVFGLTALHFADPFIKRHIARRKKECTSPHSTGATYIGISEYWRFICCRTEASTKKLKIEEHGNSSKDKDKQRSSVRGMVIQKAGDTPVTEIIIPEVINSIGTKAFMDNKDVKVIIMPNRVKVIDSYAFANCGLRKCIFPTSPIDIGLKAFARSSIKKVIIPADSTIRESAFEACHVLHSVGMPKAIKAIGRGAFANCKCLRKMSFPDLPELEARLFKNSGLKEITIPDGVLLIGEEAFASTPISKVVFRQSSMLAVIGTRAFKDCKQLKVIDLPRLRSLEQYCFSESGLQQVVFRSGLVEIHQGAFQGCEFLQAIQFTARFPTIIGRSAFENCHRLISIQTLPQSVSVIRMMAFARCQSLESFRFQDGIGELGEGIFINNINMKSCRYPDHQGTMPATIPGYTFLGTGLVRFKMPIWIRSIGKLAFSGCRDLVSVDAAQPPTITIGQQAFQRCHLLQQFDIQNVSSIGRFAFDECYSLVVEEQKWMTNIIEIPAGAFRSCFKLKRIVLPEGCTEIGDEAFRKCISLEAIKLPDSLSSIGSKSFQACEVLTTIRFPGPMTHIGKAAFKWCMMLQSADLRCALQSIPPGTFNHCKHLKKVILPVGLTTIGSKAFKNCTSLEIMDIPVGLITIGSWAFENCKSLGSMKFPVTLVRIEAHAFANCSVLTLTTIPSRVVQPCPATACNEAIDLS